MTVMRSFGVGEPEHCIYHAPGYSADADRLHSSIKSVPRSLWQTYWTDDLPNQAKAVAEKWLQLNPDYYYHFHNDEEGAAFFEEHFDSHTLEMIHNFPKGVMKADFWRYAVMYFYGGVYMDIDAMPLKALRDFKHYPFEEKRVVIGLENDEHLCYWGFISAPGHPLFATVISVIRDVWEHDKVGTQPPQFEHFVHNYTGPTIFTLAVMNFLGVSSEQVGSVYYAKYLFDQYNIPDSKVRKICDEHAIVIEDQKYFQHGMIDHYFGSWSYGDGYISWTKDTKTDSQAYHYKSNDIRELIKNYYKQSSYLQGGYTALSKDLEYCRKNLELAEKNIENEQKPAIPEKPQQVDDKRKQLKYYETKITEKINDIAELEKEKDLIYTKLSYNELSNGELYLNNTSLSKHLAFYRKLIWFLSITILLLLIWLIVMKIRLYKYMHYQYPNSNYFSYNIKHTQIGYEEDGI